MPVYQVGDLVRPRTSIDYDSEPNPDAIGYIIEMRSMTHTRPEAKIIWNDLPGCEPRWMWLAEVRLIEE